MNLTDIINYFYKFQVYACMKTTTEPKSTNVMRMNKLQLISNMGESHKCNNAQWKTDTDRHLLYDSIYVSTKQGKLVKVMEKSQWCLPWYKGEEEGYDWKRTMKEDVLFS